MEGFSMKRSTRKTSRFKGGFRVIAGVALTVGLTTGASAAFADTTGKQVGVVTLPLQNATNDAWQYKTTSSKAANIYLSRVGGDSYKINGRVQKSGYQSNWSAALASGSSTNLSNTVSAGSYTWVGIRLSTYVLTGVDVTGWFTAY
jgi:hypothetical protein